MEINCRSIIPVCVDWNVALNGHYKCANASHTSMPLDPKLQFVAFKECCVSNAKIGWKGPVIVFLSVGRIASSLQRISDETRWVRNYWQIISYISSHFCYMCHFCLAQREERTTRARGMNVLFKYMWNCQKWEWSGELSSARINWSCRSAAPLASFWVPVLWPYMVWYIWQYIFWLFNANIDPYVRRNL